LLAHVASGGQGCQAISSVSAIAQWVSLHSLSMVLVCLNQIFIATKKISNVFNGLGG
jgi:hypothetical protein